MITAKDIQKKKFEKVKFGYSPEEVDAFLSEIEHDLRLMQQELDESDQKVQLLAEKVREYKDSEEDIKNALLGAQKQAREVIAAANDKAAKIEADALASVDAVKEQAIRSQEQKLVNIEQRLESETANLKVTTERVAAFKQALFEMYKDHLEMISRLPESEDDIPYEEAPAAEETAEEAAADVAEEAVAPAEETPAEAAPADADPFEAVASSTFESRRDDVRSREDTRGRFDF